MVEIGGQDQADPAVPDQLGDGTMSGRGQLDAAVPLLVIGRLEIAMQQIPACRDRGRQGFQQRVIPRFPVALAGPPALGIRLSRVSFHLALQGGDLADQVRNNAPACRDPGRCRCPRTQQQRIDTRRCHHTQGKGQSWIKARTWRRYRRRRVSGSHQSRLAARDARSSKVLIEWLARSSISRAVQHTVTHQLAAAAKTSRFMTASARDPRTRTLRGPCHEARVTCHGRATDKRSKGLTTVPVIRPLTCTS